jgi:LAS superfamily LD-carboxypeptidase LdcB
MASGARVDPACYAHPQWSAAARINASSLTGMPWEPYRRPEVGWESYAPVIAREAGTACPPDTPGFAAALAAWQQRRGAPPDGVVSALTFQTVKGLWQERRPFVMATLKGECPPAPDASLLSPAEEKEGYFGKPVQLRTAALRAFRRMRDAALAESPAIRAEVEQDAQVFTLFSGFRDPAADELRCQTDGNCQGVVRARCSAHRTGLAMDIDLGSAPGFKPDNSDDANRRFMARTATYRWLVANADRFGFAHYVFEPWHWEWTGEPVYPSLPAPPPPPQVVAPPTSGTEPAPEVLIKKDEP